MMVEREMVSGMERSSLVVASRCRVLKMEVEGRPGGDWMLALRRRRLGRGELFVVGFVRGCARGFVE